MKYDPCNILIVEDEAAHAELTRRAIRKAGNANRIDIVGDGEEATRPLFHRGRFADLTEYPVPSLILLDIKLPGIRDRSIEAGEEDLGAQKNPGIMLSTPHRRQDITESYCQCANSYLTKPLGFRELG